MQAAAKVARPPKTPKASKTATKAPKTPKSSLKKAIVKPSQRGDGAAATKTKSVKLPKAPKIVKDAAAAVGKTKNNGAAAGEKKRSASKKGEKVLYPTLLDGLDIKNIKGQYTRARDLHKSSLNFAAELSDNGLVDLSMVPNAPEVMDTEEQIAYMAENSPIDNIRFSKNSIYFTLAAGERIFTDKAKDIHRLSRALANKQTLTLDAVWAERDYRANTNLSNAIMIRQQAPSTLETMIEDTAGAHGKPQNPIPAKAYKQLKNSVERIGCIDGGDIDAELADAASSMFPDAEGEWA